MSRFSNIYLGWNADKHNEKFYITTRILRVDNKEKRRNARLLRVQAMQAVQEVYDHGKESDRTEDDHFDLHALLYDVFVNVWNN